MDGLLSSLTQGAFLAIASIGVYLSYRVLRQVDLTVDGSFTLGGVVAGHLTNMKNTADPMATEAGVRAALLASTGYSGPVELFEHAFTVEPPLDLLGHLAEHQEIEGREDAQHQQGSIQENPQ